MGYILILENHLRTHVHHMLAYGSGDQQEKATQELLSLYELHNIRGK